MFMCSAVQVQRMRVKKHIDTRSTVPRRVLVGSHRGSASGEVGWVNQFVMGKVLACGWVYTHTRERSATTWEKTLDCFSGMKWTVFMPRVSTVRMSV